jgi:hypothetical protein
MKGGSGRSRNSDVRVAVAEHSQPCLTRARVSRRAFRADLIVNDPVLAPLGIPVRSDVSRLR